MDREGKIREMNGKRRRAKGRKKRRGRKKGEGERKMGKGWEGKYRNRGGIGRKEVKERDVKRRREEV